MCRELIEKDNISAERLTVRKFIIRLIYRISLFIYVKKKRGEKLQKIKSQLSSSCV